MSVNKDSKYHSLSKEVYEQILGDREHGKINPYACKDSDIIRRQPDHDAPHLWRPAFVMDVERYFTTTITIAILIRHKLSHATRTMIYQDVHFTSSLYPELQGLSE